RTFDCPNRSSERRYSEDHRIKSLKIPQFRKVKSDRSWFHEFFSFDSFEQPVDSAPVRCFEFSFALKCINGQSRFFDGRWGVGSTTPTSILILDACQPFQSSPSSRISQAIPLSIG